MNNPAKKGRELLKAARSQALITKTEEKIINNPNNNIQGNNKCEDEVNNINHVADNCSNIYNKSNDGNVSGVTSNVTNTSIVEDKTKSTMHDVISTGVKVNERFLMFDNNKNKINVPSNNNNAKTMTSSMTTNKINLLNRMNKDKEPTRLMGIRQTPVSVIEHKLDSTHLVNETIQEGNVNNKNETLVDDNPHIELAPLKSGDQDKLMKRMISAKGMNKGLTKDKGDFNKKQSEKIMGMASMLQSKLTHQPGQELQSGVMPPMKKFLLSDDDIQQIDDEHKTVVSHGDNKLNFHINKNENFENVSGVVNLENKSLVEIILEKPTNKRVKKKTRGEFILDN